MAACRIIVSLSAIATIIQGQQPAYLLTAKQFHFIFADGLSAEDSQKARETFRRQPGPGRCSPPLAAARRLLPAP
jgi:hypothetical protein